MLKAASDFEAGEVSKDVGVPQRVVGNVPRGARRAASGRAAKTVRVASSRRS